MTALLDHLSRRLEANTRVGASDDVLLTGEIFRKSLLVDPQDLSFAMMTPSLFSSL